MGRARLAAFVAPAAILPLATLACRQLVGIGDAPPQGPETSTDAGAEGGFTYGQGDCEACVADQCAAQASACARLPSCSALEECMSGCNGDATCRAQCGVDHGLGNDVATPAFEACLEGSCGAACGLSCGDLAAVFPPATATLCASCIAMSECASVNACVTDPTCQAAVRCQFSSDTVDVWEACPRLPGQDAGAGASLFSQNPPIASSCATECSWGADWSRVGKVNWPPARLGSLEATALVYDALSGAPTDNATVNLCNSADSNCAPPLATGTTGDAGTVTLLGSPVQVPLLYYLDVSSPAIVPTLEFIVFPISEPQISIPVFTIAPANLSLLSLAGVTLDPELGTVFVNAVDCRLAEAPGVTFSIDPVGQSQVIYYQNRVPELSATATDPEGIGVFINVPVGQSLTLTVTPQVLGRPSGTMAFFTKPGTIAAVYAVPTATP